MRTDSKVVLTKDELVEWHLNPITQKIKLIVKEQLKDVHSKLGNGWTLHRGSIEKTALETAEMVGKIEGLEFIFNLEGD